MHPCGIFAKMGDEFVILLLTPSLGLMQSSYNVSAFTAR